MKFLFFSSFTLHAVFITLLPLFVVPSSGICLPCQASNGRSSPWEAFSSTKRRGLTSREIYNPKITSPTNSTVWVVDSTVVVTWDIKDMPIQVSNPKGTLLLGYLDDGNYDEHLNFHHKLASDFDIKTGFVKFKVPQVEPRKNYIVVLYGDSGNRSPLFTVIAK